MIGYDFEKCIWETDEIIKKIKLVSFPQPQIISTEADYKYYNFDENIFQYAWSGRPNPYPGQW